MGRFLSVIRPAYRLSGLLLAGVFAVAAVRPAAATLCTEFTLTAAHVSVFQNGSWVNTPFQQTGPGQFRITRNASWPAQVSVVLRWDINPGAHPDILPAVYYAPEPVYWDYQFVGEGFGTSFGVVAQVNNIAVGVGSHTVYMELVPYLPDTGCDLIRSDIATMTVLPAPPNVPEAVAPHLSCLPPNCGPQIRRPGDDVINPGFVERIQPEEIVPQAVQPQRIVPQLQLRGGQ